MANSDTHKRRLKPVPEGRKCKQCRVEKAHPGRIDGLGIKCGEMHDKTLQKAQRHAEEMKRASK